MLLDFLFDMSTFEAIVVFWLAAIFWMLVVIGRILEKALLPTPPTKKKTTKEIEKVTAHSHS